ncbi:MAG: ATP-dependent helicase [Candidatus Pacebacteria bacterium]|nr:ATP-dependent helicase [Candidatus Paceibacterota bacterium]
MKSAESANSKPHVTFEDRYKKLNTAQKKAVDTIEGPLLVVAGPGSGKTEILSLRVAKILKEAQILPSNILCLTFTDSAAVNMRDRLSRLIGAEAYRVSIHTFHSFSVDIIQKYPEFFYKGAIFSPADAVSQIGILESIFDSLPHKDLLKSSHPEEGYTYLQDVSRVIGYLKKAGITPSRFADIIEKNSEAVEKINSILVPAAEKRVSAAVIAELKNAAESLRSCSTAGGASETGQYIGEFPALEHAVALTLLEAIDTAEKTEKNEPISKWKAKWFKANDEGEKVFRDTLNLDKMRSVAHIYKQYREVMHARCLFDFDDMILDVIEAIQTHPRLKFDLQEQYQYVLVDEFQDTNNAQMKILSLVLDAEVNEGRPNIMVVGDDDQAVYKFQGAELSNILNFKEMYTDVEVVNMTANYRSTQEILDTATKIIRKGEHRLENILPAFEKTLVSSNKDLAKGGIVHKVFDTSLHEYHYVSRRIKSLIESGVPAEDIAVIARKHKQLEAIVPYLQGARVPIRYEREQNVFLEPHIEQIIIMSRFIQSVSAKDMQEADEFLPKILAFPFFSVSRIAIWNISKQAYAERKTWLECMLEDTSGSLAPLANFFIELGAMARVEPLEKVLDILIGAHVELIAESEEDEDLAEDATNVAQGKAEKSTQKNPGVAEKSAKMHADTNSKYAIGGYSSPFKAYYFSKERFEHARAEYLAFLSSLRVFVRALREFKGKDGSAEQLYISDLIYFVDIHVKNGITLNDLSPFANSSKAVSLLSAHKAKGLEFDTVFVLSCQDDVWAGRGAPKRISMPANLPIEPAGDNEDDQLRLFYVALTRAKRNLYMTSYKIKDDGKESQKLRFLTEHEETDAPMEKEFGTIYTPETHELLTSSWLLYHTPPFMGEEEELLKSLLENYQLSVTHLNNFLNVSKGGPQSFLEQNLLRFPQAKTPSSAYGTAIHSTLERVSVKLRHDGILATKEECLDWFTQYLRKERLSNQDFDQYSERGLTALDAFYDQRIAPQGDVSGDASTKVQGGTSGFKATDKTEINFKDQGVVIESMVGDERLKAHLTGKLDRLVDLGGGRAEVIDYKTGKAKSEWKPGTEYEKIKLYEYERQLMFYHILLEQARDYKRNFRFEKGVLQFVEPLQNGKIVELALNEDAEKKTRTERLALIVFNKIINLDFPDTSTYGEKLEDIIAFEDSLLGK